MFCALSILDMDLDDRELEDGEILSPADKDPTGGLMAPPSSAPSCSMVMRGGTGMRRPRLRIGYGVGGFIARPRARGSLMRRMGMGRLGPNSGDFGRFEGKFGE